MRDIDRQLEIVDDNNNSYLIYTNNPNDFGEGDCLLEPRNFISEAIDCGMVNYFSAKYDFINKKLYLTTDKDNRPTIDSTIIDFMLYINRTRVNFDKYESIVDNELTLEFDMSSDEWVDEDSVRVVLMVAGNESNLGCALLKNISWLDVNKFLIDKSDDGVYSVVKPLEADNVIFDISNFTYEWYINDQKIDTSESTSTTYSQLMHLLDDNQTSYNVELRIPEIGYSIVYEEEIINRNKYDLSYLIQEVLDYDSLAYNILGVSKNSDVYIGFYDIDGVLIGSGKELVLGYDEINGPSYYLVLSETEMKSTFNPTSYNDYLIYNVIKPTYDSIRIVSYEAFLDEVCVDNNSLLSVNDNEFVLDFTNIDNTGVMVSKCFDYIDCDNTVDTDIYEYLHYDTLTKEPKTDGFAFINPSDGASKVYDEDLTDYIFELLNTVVKGAVDGN